MREALEKLAWRLAGFKGHRVRRTSLIKSFPNPVELLPPKGRPIVILSPHMDDEAIAMGGTICHFLKAGCPVHVIYITKGDVGGVPERRRNEADCFGRYCFEKFAVPLKQYFLDNGDVAVNVQRSQREVRGIVSGIKPAVSIAFAPCRNDNHKDHADTHNILMALRDGMEDTIFLGYELWSALDCPAAFVDITGYVELKQEMIEVYESQSLQKDYASIILALNKYRGGVLAGNNRYAEVFERI